jgi:hypothetical protein
MNFPLAHEHLIPFENRIQNEANKENKISLDQFIHSTICHSISSSLNLILSSHSRLGLPSRLSDQNCVGTSHISEAGYIPNPSFS